MARKFHRRQRLSAVSEINLTPLIDLAFSLLIIFMVTTPLLEQTIALNLPVETHHQPADRSDLKFQVVSIDASGSFFWGKENVGLERLDKLLYNLSQETDPLILDIRADRTIAYQKIVDLLTLIKKHKLTKISLDTEVR